MLVIYVYVCTMCLCCVCFSYPESWSISLEFIHPCYSVDMPHTLLFIHVRGHKLPNNYMTYFDHLEVENVIFSLYDDHHQTRPFDDIFWYSWWLKCDHKVVYRHFPERWRGCMVVSRPLRGILPLYQLLMSCIDR